MSTGAALFVTGVLVGVLLTRVAVWVAAKARILEIEDAFDERLAHERQLQRWREQALLRAEGIEMHVVHGQGEAGAVTVLEESTRVLPIRRQVGKGERGA